MNSTKILTWAIALVVFAMLALPLPLVAQNTRYKLIDPGMELAAQQETQGPGSLAPYTVTDLGTLGGTFSAAYGIDNRGLVTGFSTLPGDAEVHAFVWENGVMTDLGTLGGPNSSNIAPPNERGEVPGYAETPTADPVGEHFCGFETSFICLPVIWRNGVIAATLPTLGGNNAHAEEINNRGQVVGVAENTTKDPTCITPEVFSFKPVVWEKGVVHELPTVGGDPDGGATRINDKGQIIGGTGTCTALLHGVFWQDGRATDLGTVGGLVPNPQDINNQAQVVGNAFSPDSTILRAFLWQNGVAIDLGTLPGDVASLAHGINNKGQVVGASFDVDGNERAILWQNGVMTDLNSLIPANSPLFLITATGHINDGGQIAGFAFEASTGEVHAFLATPNKGESIRTSTKSTALGEANRSLGIVLPDEIRKVLQRSLSRYPFPTISMEPPK